MAWTGSRNVAELLFQCCEIVELQKINDKFNNLKIDTFTCSGKLFH